MFDDDTGYDLNDPKHPSYYDRMCDHADWAVKWEKEHADMDRPFVIQAGLPAYYRYVKPPARRSWWVRVLRWWRKRAVERWP